MTAVLNLTDAKGFLKKISINVLHKDANDTVFTLPVEGVEFNREQLNEFLGPRTFESWYDHGSDGVWRPMQWWGRRKHADYPIADTFDCKAALIVVDGSQRLEFETVEADDNDEDGEDIPAARISAIVFTPTAGGVTKVAFHMQVRPGLGRTNTTLQEYQYRWLQITLSETKLCERKGTQQTLDLQQPQQQPTEGAGFAAAAVEANTLVWWQHGITGEQGSGARKDMPKDCVEIDPPTGSASEAQQQGQAGETAEDLEAFERDASAQVAAFNARPGDVVDGRSERVRHQDQMRAKGEAA